MRTNISSLLQIEKKLIEHAFKRLKPIEYEAIYGIKPISLWALDDKYLLVSFRMSLKKKKVIEFYSEEPNIDGIYEEE